MAEWCFRTASEQARAIRARVVTSTELVRQHIDRIERLDGSVNSVVVRSFEVALERAAAADAALAEGDVWGPMHGVPITIKEAWMVKGLPATAAIKELRGHIASANALGVQLLLDAGAVILGKTNVPPFCGDIQSANTIYGRTSNPFDLARTPGGSSGGAAAAVACGFAALELGSDVGGSIRVPSHWCGIFGHKLSYGIGHLHGHTPGATHRALDPKPSGMVRARFDPSFHHQLAVSGPMGRSCADLELAVRILAKPDPALSDGGWSFALPPPRISDVRALRVAAWLDSPLAPTDRHCLPLLESAVNSLSAAGAVVDRQARPFDDETALKAMGTYLALLTASDPVFQPKDQQPLPHVTWLQLEVKRSFVKDAWLDFFEHYDVLLCPANPIAAPMHSQESLLKRTYPGEGIPDAVGMSLQMFMWAGLVTLADLPATVVPVGRTPLGLPCGIQIVAPNFCDLTSIEVGKMLERCHPGTRFEPPSGFCSGITQASKL